MTTRFRGQTALAARRWLARAACFGVWVVGLAVLLGGCGPGLYVASLRPARRAIESAREAGAEELAPYDYYFALAHLDKAREEAAESAFQDAADHARVAREHAERAQATCREVATAP